MIILVLPCDGKVMGLTPRCSTFTECLWASHIPMCI